MYYACFTVCIIRLELLEARTYFFCYSNHPAQYLIYCTLSIKLNAWRDEIKNKEQGYLMVLFWFWNNAILPFKRENISTCHWLPSFRGRYKVKGQSQSTFCCVQVRKEITILQRACSTKISTLICRAKWLDIFT